MTALTGREIIARYLAAGMTPDEVADKLGTGALLLDGDGSEILHLRDTFGQRRLREIIGELRGDPATGGCPSKLQEVEIAYRRAGDDRPSQEMVAARMGVDPRTVRRYAGMSWSQLHAHMATHHPR